MVQEITTLKEKNWQQEFKSKERVLKINLIITAIGEADTAAMSGDLTIIKGSATKIIKIAGGCGA